MTRSRSNLFTVTEAAEIIGFHPDYVRRLILEGKVKAQKLGKNWFLRMFDIAKVKRQRFPRIKGSKRNGKRK